MANDNATQVNRGWTQLFQGAGPSVRLFSGLVAQLDVVDSIEVQWNGVFVKLAEIRDPAPVWRDLEAVWASLGRLTEGRVFYPVTDSAPPGAPDEPPCSGDCDSGSCSCIPCLEKRLETHCH